VIGGSRVIIESLLDAVGLEGTVVMPTYSGDNSDPTEWKYPAIPPDHAERVLEESPAYDPRLTPTRGVGLIPEYFRNWPNAKRSRHPQSSYAAVGAQAEELTQLGEFDYRFGIDSPLGKIYRNNGKVILIGAPWNTTAIFYLSEFHMPWKKEKTMKSKISENGKDHWIQYRDLIYDISYFDAGIEMLLSTGIAQQGFVGEAPTVIFSSREAVDQITSWRLKQA
jgi:aminoglycoside 3-N-acetyltransferase